MVLSIALRCRALILTGGIGLAVGMAGIPLTSAHAESLNVVEHAVSDTVVDIGDKGDSAGDVLAFSNEVYDEANSNKVGTDNGWCIRTAAGKSWECFWTMMLDGGQITVEGPYLDAGDSTLAITGGTGKYVNVRGEMQLHARNAQGSEYDFKFTLSQ